MADRALAYLRKALNWHAARSDDFNSPVVRGMSRTKAKERARDRTLTDEEIRDLWAALETVGDHLPFCFPLCQDAPTHRAAPQGMQPRRVVRNGGSRR
jgi:hypothetical protein